MITIIVCIARNRAIGLRGGLLYHLRADLRRFKELTTGHTVVMGRKTYESLPKGALPNRRNIVLTHSGRVYPGTEVFASLPEALQHCAEGEQVFIIGGSSVYQEALPLADRLCLTLVDDTPAEADTFFPEIRQEDWQEIFREQHAADEHNERPFCFVDLIRKGV
ncbi:MAG: dihydrofolate reductase [Bacteroidaceae bacterium]|nr:dihydrofolate reductase [Bacteroidaceae bacterium]